MQVLAEKLENYIPKDKIRCDEPMAGHTTFRIGGPVKYLVEPENTQQLTQVLKMLQAEEVPYFILGNGSNLLVSDEGYDGVVVKIGPAMSRIQVEGTLITAGAGALMSQVARTALEHGLTGLEFASGIPGTLGGGIVMNAGAYGGELSQVVRQVTVLTGQGDVRVLDNASMHFGYRHSIIKEEKWIVTEIVMELQSGDKALIQATMEDLAARRREKQPLEYPSAGSTFKRPEGYFAGELIMKAGLRGYQVGGARVSDKHCGFVVNMGGATAKDVHTVITDVQDKVREAFGVELEPEVIFLSNRKLHERSGEV